MLGEIPPETQTVHGAGGLEEIGGQAPEVLVGRPLRSPLSSTTSGAITNARPWGGVVGSPGKKREIAFHSMHSIPFIPFIAFHFPPHLGPNPHVGGGRTSHTLGIKKSVKSPPGRDGHLLLANKGLKKVPTTDSSHSESARTGGGGGFFSGGSNYVISNGQAAE